ncbi:MAG: hypothetical protein MUF21_14140 [Gemmatimonadaceae bacterium]|nr:hypothetical protein [Gemmatimonadaceae bacterium]
MPPAAPRPARPAAVVPLVLSLLAASPPTILGAQPAPCVPATPRADAGSGSVRDFLAAPFTEQLVASGEGRTIAWVTTSDGRRAVRIATPGAADGGWRVRTRWTSCDDDGQEITELAVSRDGARLVWVRGGAPNRAGETPNPTSDPRGVERAIWLADTSEAAPRRVAAGASPALSPDGTRLAFIAGGALQHLALDDATATPVKLAMRGTPGDVRWSPDGTRLAFASDRGTHRIVGLYELATQRITWLEPSTDRDLALAWSPDGRQLAWVRVPSIVAGAPIFVPQRRADVPWALMVADVASGRVTRPFVADTGRGSAWQPFEGSAALHWAWDARSIIVPWEKDGWLRPWRIPLDGGAPRALTTCACEAGYVAMERIGMGELRGPDHVLPVTAIAPGDCRRSPTARRNRSIAATRGRTRRCRSAASGSPSCASRTTRPRRCTWPRERASRGSRGRSSRPRSRPCARGRWCRRRSRSAPRTA